MLTIYENVDFAMSRKRQKNFRLRRPMVEIFSSTWIQMIAILSVTLRSDMAKRQGEATWRSDIAKQHCEATLRSVIANRHGEATWRSDIAKRNCEVTLRSDILNRHSEVVDIAKSRFT